MKTGNQSRRILMGSLCLCFFWAAADAYGQNRTWLGAGADGNWGTAGNWSTSIANNFNSALVFDGTAPILSSTNTLSGGTATGVTFNANSAGYTLSGSAINLNGNITNSGSGAAVINLDIALVGSGTRTMNQNGGGNGSLTINGVISGSGAVSTAAASASYSLFTGQNTFTGRMLLTARDTRFTSIANIGQPSSLGAGSIVRIGQNGTECNLNYYGGAASSDKQFEIGAGDTVGSNGGAINNNGTGGLVFTSATFNVAPVAGITAQLTPSPNLDPGLVRESSCPCWGWKGFSDEEATQCRADRGPASAG